jgi:hypothetical protein
MSASETTSPSVVSLTEKDTLEQGEFVSVCVSVLKTGPYYGWPETLYANQGPAFNSQDLSAPPPPFSSWNAETKDEHTTVPGQAFLLSAPNHPHKQGSSY